MNAKDKHRFRNMYKIKVLPMWVHCKFGGLVGLKKRIYKK